MRRAEGGASADRDWLRPYPGGACPFPPYRWHGDARVSEAMGLEEERIDIAESGVGWDRHRRSTAGASPINSKQSLASIPCGDGR